MFKVTGSERICTNEYITFLLWSRYFLYGLVSTSCSTSVKSMLFLLVSMKREQSPLWPCFCLPLSVVSAGSVGTPLLALAPFQLWTPLSQGLAWVICETGKDSLCLSESCNRLSCSHLQESRCKPKSKQKRYCLFQRRHCLYFSCRLLVAGKECQEKCDFTFALFVCSFPHYYHWSLCWRQDSWVGEPLVLSSMVLLMFLWWTNYLCKGTRRDFLTHWILLQIRQLLTPAPAKDRVSNYKP